MKTWYAARVRFESTVGDGPNPRPLYEESIRIILGESIEDATARAEAIGRAAEHEYPNEAGEVVRWVFASVLEVQDLCESELQDGMEVFSTLFRGDEGQEV
jgi:hypothetical protein